MDRLYGKRAVGGLCVPKNASLVSRDADNRNGDAQFCNRLGCSGRLKYTKAAQIGSPRIPKSLRPSTRSTNAKETGGSISSTSSVVNNAKIRYPDSRRKLRSEVEKETSDSSSAQNEIEIQELTDSQRTKSRGFQSEPREAESGIVPSVKVRSSNVVSKARNPNSFYKRPGLTNQDALPSSSSSPSGSNDQGPSGSTNASRQGLRSLRTSISAALRPGSSLSESNISKKKDIVKKRSPEREASSSSRGKNKTSEQPSDGGHISNPTYGFTFPDHRRNRNLPPRRENGVTSAQSRRLPNSNTRTGHPSLVNRTILSSAEASVFRRQMPRSERNIFANANSLREEASSGGSSSYSHSSSGNYDDHVTTTPSADLGIARLVNRDGAQQYNMDNIAEVLLALERIEQQDEELTYEQLLALGTNYFFGGLGVYDQHRDMRLEIDNMSYEELLALEEKMGNVSTALSEDALLKSVTMSTYQPVCSDEEEAASSVRGEDTKCSICQEEYVAGDEVGKIGCEHGYHMECIKQWLQLKNWCPICKASVEPRETS
ncbi:hypothetical protein ACET3Z_030773 [Daucus carota]